jgi:vacuolar protein sorting-associated protein 1
MDRGTDARKMLTGEDVPLRLGYTGVRNRSQADIRSGKGIQEALQVNLDAFLMSDPPIIFQGRKIFF